MATIVLGAWTYLVVSYDSPLGTDNVVNVERTSTSNGTSDALATLSFQDGAEDLDWASTLIEIEVNDTSYTCSFGSQSIEAESNAKVNSRLSSDGVTFSTTIDATSEDAFSYFSVPLQREGMKHPTLYEHQKPTSISVMMFNGLMFQNPSKRLLPSMNPNYPIQQKIA